MECCTPLPSSRSNESFDGAGVGISNEFTRKWRSKLPPCENRGLWVGCVGGRPSHNGTRMIQFVLPCMSQHHHNPAVLPLAPLAACLKTLLKASRRTTIHRTRAWRSCFR